MAQGSTVWLIALECPLNTNSSNSDCSVLIQINENDLVLIINHTMEWGLRTRMDCGSLNLVSPGSQLQRRCDTKAQKILEKLLDTKLENHILQLGVLGDVHDSFVSLFRTRLPLMVSDKSECLYFSNSNLSFQINCTDHPSLRGMLLWLRDERPIIRCTSFIPNWGSENIPQCLVFDAVTVDWILPEVGHTHNTDGHVKHRNSSGSIYRIGDRLLVVGSQIIEPAFTALFEMHFLTSSAVPHLVNTENNLTNLIKSNRRKSSSDLSTSPRTPGPSQDGISIGGDWTPIRPRSSTTSDSRVGKSSVITMDDECEEIKKSNKALINRLMLLSLRNRGIHTAHPEYATILKQLYATCVFSLRQELTKRVLGQEEILSLLHSNMNFLNIR